MDLGIEDSRFAEPGRAMAIGFGGTLCILSSAFAVAITVGFIWDNAALAFMGFMASLSAFGAGVATVVGMPLSSASLWRGFVTVTGAAVLLWPAGLIVQWIRGWIGGDDLTYSALYLMTWPAVIACGLLGGLLIAIGRVARR
jgi:hypothetical protein